VIEDIRRAVEASLVTMEEVYMDLLSQQKHIEAQEDPCDEDPVLVEFYQDIHEKVLESYVEVTGQLIHEINRNKARRKALLDEMRREAEELGLYEED